MDLRELTKINVRKLNVKPSRGEMALSAVRKGEVIRLNGFGGFIIVNEKEEKNGKDNGN